MKLLITAVLLIFSVCSCHLVALRGEAYRIDFSPGYVYVVRLKGSQPQSIYVAKITEGKLKRIPQTIRMTDDQFTIFCTMTSETLTGFASLHGEIAIAKDGVPEIDSLRGELIGVEPSKEKKPNQSSTAQRP